MQTQKASCCRECLAKPGKPHTKDCPHCPCEYCGAEYLNCFCGYERDPDFDVAGHLERKRQEVTENKAHRRASICWLLRDRRWHRLSEIYKAFPGCLGNEDPYLADDFECDEDSAREGGRRLCKVTLDGLLKDEICVQRWRKGHPSIRLVNPGADVKKRHEVVLLFEQAVQAIAQDALKRNPAPTPKELYGELIRLDNQQTPFSEHWSKRAFIIHLALEGYTRKVTLAGLSDNLFWFKAGFFDPARLHYFAEEEADEPTRMFAKAVTVDVLSGRVTCPPVEFLDETGEAYAAWVGHDLIKQLSPGSNASLASAVWEIATRQGGDPNTIKLSYDAAIKGVDWAWVGRRLSAELGRHSHRRRLRALELACAMPYEHIEAKLDGFVGSLEEMFLRVIHGA